VRASSNRLAGQSAPTSRSARTWSTPAVSTSSSTRESQAALESFRSSGPETEQRLAMLWVSVQEYDIADVRPVFGEGAEWIGGTDSATTDEIGARSGRIER
jgi:hypothetical protein